MSSMSPAVLQHLMQMLGTLKVLWKGGRRQKRVWLARRDKSSGSRLKLSAVHPQVEGDANNGEFGITPFLDSTADDIRTVPEETVPWRKYVVGHLLHATSLYWDEVLQLLGRESLQDEALLPSRGKFEGLRGPTWDMWGASPGRAQDACRSILGRAPRVVLHLLRAADLQAGPGALGHGTL